jgi:hypothetical protein
VASIESRSLELLKKISLEIFEELVHVTEHPRSRSLTGDVRSCSKSG